MPGAISSSRDTARLCRSSDLRRHQDQRLAEVALELAAQDVEVVRRRRAVGDLHVVFGAHLQDSARAAPRNAPAPGPRSRAAAADEARHAQPLALARGDELVEHHLRAVGEIAELRLPQRQRVGLGQRIAVFEAEHGLFRQHRVDDLVARLLAAEMVERGVALLGLLVDQHRMALREGAALAVLAGQAHRMPSVQQRCRRPAPRRSPSRCPRRSRSPCARLSRKRWIVRWTWKPSGTVVILLADVAQHRPASTPVSPRRGSSTSPRGLQARPAAVEPVGLVGPVALAGLELGVERGAPVGLHLLDLGLGDRRLRRPAAWRRSPASSDARVIVLYISGWVKAGSSPSLWPKRR